jgi:hypothetical protein
MLYFTLVDNTTERVCRVVDTRWAVLGVGEAVPSIIHIAREHTVELLRLFSILPTVPG